MELYPSTTFYFKRDDFAKSPSIAAGFFVSLLLLSFLFSTLALSLTNTLDRNGNWVTVGAPKAGFRLMHNHLVTNLAGVNEFLLNRKGHIRSVEFDFSLGPGGAFVFHFNKTRKSEPIEGIRISINNRYISGYISKMEDQILTFLPIRQLGPDDHVHKMISNPHPHSSIKYGWNHARFEQVSDSESTFQLNDKNPVALPVTLKPGGGISFRGLGSDTESWIDNVVVRFHNAPDFYEDFSGRTWLWPLTLALSFGLLLLEAAVFFFSRVTMKHLLWINLFASSCVLSLFILDWVWLQQTNWFVI